jgi:hypothetical protein
MHNLKQLTTRVVNLQSSKPQRAVRTILILIFYFCFELNVNAQKIVNHLK